MEVTSDLLLRLLTALGLGALIGAEREMHKLKNMPGEMSFAGLRTYGLVSMVGFVGAYLGRLVGAWIVPMLLLAITLFFLAAYVHEAQKLNFFGITSEISAVITFLIGVIAFSNSLLAVILGVVTVLVLTLKEPLHRFVRTLDPGEFLSAIKFIIITFIVLPLLPREAVDPWGLISLFDAWLMVVLVSGISFVGYILVRLVGTEKGLSLTALVGGLASSTATTMSIAEQGRHNKKIVIPFVLGVITASTVMFGRALLEVAVINRTLFRPLASTLGVMILMSLFMMLVLWQFRHWRDKNARAPVITLTSPFQFWPAFQFAVLYIIILLAAKLGNHYLGQRGIYFASLIAGLADIDAITLSLSSLSAEGKISGTLAVRGITIAVMVNTLVKAAIVRIFGTATLFRYTLIPLLLVLLSGVVAMVVL